MARKSAAAAAPKPKVFIGSSSEGLEIAKAIAANLEKFVEPHTWPHIFSLAENTVESLEKEVKECQFAVFVFTPDDDINSRARTSRPLAITSCGSTGSFRAKTAASAPSSSCPRASRT